MLNDRIPLYAEIEKCRQSKVITYVTSDRQGATGQIAPDVFDFFVNHLDAIGPIPKISLFLYTRGGGTLAAWSIVNLIRQFCDDFEVIIPSKCHSAGTLMALGANRIVMTKQATLGPIDPSINGPLNPPVEGRPNERVPISVEAIQGYFELAKEEIGIKNDESLANILLKLSDKVHPLVLGDVYRTRSQIQMLARKLIASQLTDEVKINKVISFLCSDSGSHDYTISRREARDELGLVTETPDQAFYECIKAIYDDFAAELSLSTPFDQGQIIGQNPGPVNFVLKRALVESIQSGSYFFCTEGEVSRIQPAAPAFQMPNGVQLPPGMFPVGPALPILQVTPKYEGWRHEK